MQTNERHGRTLCDAVFEAIPQKFPVRVRLGYGNFQYEMKRSYSIVRSVYVCKLLRCGDITHRSGGEGAIPLKRLAFGALRWRCGG